MAGQPVDLRFTRGIDAQNDSRMVETPFLLQADNVYFDREGGPRKRSGYTTYANLIAGGYSRLNATSVVSNKNTLLALDDTNVYSYSATENVWVTRDALIPCMTTMRPASPTQTRQRFVESARWQNSYELHIYQNSRSPYDIRYSMLDPADNSFLVYDQLLVTTTSASVTARIVQTASNLIVCWMNNDGWYGKVISPDAMTAPGPTTKLTSATGIANFAFDGTYTVMAVNTSSSNSQCAVTLYRILPNLVSTQIVIIDGLVPGSPQAIDIIPYASLGNGRFILTFAAWNGSGFPAAISQESYDIAANAYLVPKNQNYWTFNGISYIQQVAALSDASGNATTYVCFLQPGPNGTSQNACGTITPSDLTNIYNIIGNMFLASRPFVFKGSVYAFFILMVQSLNSVTYSLSSPNLVFSPTNPQSCVFLINTTVNRVVAQIGYGVSNASPAFRLATPMVNGNLYEIPILKTIKTIGAISDGVPQQVISSFVYGVNFTSAYNLQNARMGDIRLFAGGIINSFDGARVSEQGFLLSPDIIGCQDSTNSGSVPKGVYQICAVYEWTDAQGTFYRSAPGQSVTYTADGSATVLPQFTVANLNATNKTNVTIALYATRVNGSVFYRWMYAANGSGSLGTVFTPTAFPSGTISAETLYTTGNVLANDPWPASVLMTTSRNRVFTVNSEDSEVITYSKSFVKNEGMAISLAFTQRVSAVPGPITAIAAMDDKVVVFKSRAILYFYGQNGPAVDGSNNDFSPPQILTTEIGCVAPNSIIATADGVYFQSEKGIWLLSRALQLTFVGQPVAPLAIGKNITSAVLIPNQTTIRFGALGSPSLVYHYRYQAQYGNSLACGQWTTFSNYSQFNATLHQGMYVFARSDGKICAERTGYYKDDTSPVSFTLRTSWQRVGALMQMGQFTDISLLGAYEGPHTLALNLYRDYRDAPDTTLKYDSSVGVATTKWGGSASWGAQPTFGGDSDNTYVARWKLPGSYSGVGALSLSVTDAPTPGLDFGASCQLLGLTLIAQAQSDLAHLGDKKRQ